MRLLPLAVLCLALAAAMPLHAATLTLAEAERLAIERNLNLQAQTYATRAAEALVRRGFGVYDPVLQADVAQGSDWRRINEQVFSAVTKTDYRRFNFSLLQLFPTGGSLALIFDNRRQDVSPAAPTLINPSYDSVARLSLIQPLLRGFGRTVVEQEILFAVHDRNISVQDLRERAFEVISAVRDAWFDALRFRDEVEFRRTSVALAERVLEENRARVEAGVLAPVEILEAQVGAQLRERELLDSLRAYQDALDRLTLRLNLQEQVDVAAEALAAPPVEVSEEEGFRIALAKRPELMRQLQQVERLELARYLARNNLLPQVDFTASYGHSGLGGEYSEVIDDLSDDQFRSWEVGVLFSYPLGNREARSELLRTRLLLNSQQSQVAQLRDEIRQQIRAAIRDLEVNRKKIEVTDLGTRLATERLDTLLKRKEVGLATTRDVLEGEEDLAEARTLHISALADYNQAITGYLRATGLLLEHEGIVFTGDFSPKSERPLLQPQ